MRTHGFGLEVLRDWGEFRVEARTVGDGASERVIIEGTSDDKRQGQHRVGARNGAVGKPSSSEEP
jgi:hypothetical protein